MINHDELARPFGVAHLQSKFLNRRRGGSAVARRER